MSKYEAYWLTDFPFIGCMPRNNYIDSQKSKQKVLVILELIGIIVKKSKEQGWSSTPADILMNI